MASHISHGADVERLDDIAVRLRRQSERIADAGERGASLLERLRAHVDGPDFEKFAHSWRTAHEVMTDAEASMRTFSRHLADESDAQRRTSGVASRQSHGEGILRPTGGGSGRDVGGQVFERTDRLPGVPVVGDSLVPVLPDLSGAEAIHPSDTGTLAFERLDQPAEQQVDLMSGHSALTPPSSAWAQAPAGEGAHVLTSGDSVGQRSVVFNPLTETMCGDLGRDDLHVQPWQR